jgi:hypothetical protein
VSASELLFFHHLAVSYIYDQFDLTSVPPSVMTAVERPKHAVMQSSLILAVPNEIIFEILANLSPPTLRSIRNTNKRLRILAEDKLRRDNGALFSLSSALILKIAQHLSARDCSRFARVSPRYYSLITEKILRQNVEKGGSSLLYFAAKDNSTRMARRLLEYGAEINARMVCHRETWTRR